MAKRNDNLEKTRRRLADLHDEIERLSARERDLLKGEAVQHDAKYQAMVREEEQARDVLHKLRVRVARKRTSIESHTEKIKLREAEIADLETEIKPLEGAHAALLDTISQRENELVDELMSERSANA